MSTARRPGIRDVARLAGVSITTVSHAMNGKGRVDPETRARVQQAVDELGWRPQRSAQALRSGRTGTLALCLPRRPDHSGSWMTSVDYYMELTIACVAVVMNSERHLLVSPPPQRRRDVDDLQVDGVIVVDPPEHDVALELLDEAGVPYVTVNRDLGSSDPWWVGDDNERNVTTLLDHLSERGAERIALLSSSERWAWFADTHAAYHRWCDDHGKPPRIGYVDLDFLESSGQTATAELLAADPPDAIIALPYGSALGAIRAARESGLDVPRDLLVASGVDGHALQTFTPSVTALDLRPDEVADTAVELLLRRIDGDAPSQVIVAADLRVRTSTSPTTATHVSGEHDTTTGSNQETS